MEKPQKKTSSSSSSSKGTLHFFKVFLPSYTSMSLKIPSAFVNRLNEEMPRRAILEDPLGRLCHVEVEKVEGACYFQNGWSGFVKNNCLVLGEFLVFSYRGDSLFYVDIFDSSGCQKADGLDRLNVDRPIHGLEERHREGERKKENLEPVTSVATNVNVADAFDEPKNPYFVASLTPWRRHCLNIPKRVVVDNEVNIKPKMILRDHNQRSWPVRVWTSCDGRKLLTKGWSSFCTENNLTSDDKCIFEFNKCKGSSKDTNVIKVTTVRSKGEGSSALHKNVRNSDVTRKGTSPLHRPVPRPSGNR